MCVLGVYDFGCVIVGLRAWKFRVLCVCVCVFVFFLV